MYITHTHYVRVCAVAKKFDIAKIYEIIQTRIQGKVGGKRMANHTIYGRDIKRKRFVLNRIPLDVSYAPTNFSGDIK